VLLVSIPPHSQSLKKHPPYPLSTWVLDQGLIRNALKEFESLEFSCFHGVDGSTVTLRIERPPREGGKKFIQSISGVLKPFFDSGIE